jgi:hypothetical protein
VSDVIKERPPMAFTTRGPMHPRRTVDLVIPCRVASPQSPTPFHQVASDQLRQNNAASRHRTPESASENRLILGLLLKKRHEVTHALWRRTKVFNGLLEQLIAELADSRIHEDATVQDSRSSWHTLYIECTPKPLSGPTRKCTSGHAVRNS